MNELFNTLKDIILHFLPNKEKESEALDKFISAANQESKYLTSLHTTLPVQQDIVTQPNERYNSS